MTDTPTAPTDAPAFLTDEVDPIGGVIKQRCEDFLVEEIPSIDPAGEGSHTWLFVEKTDRTTEDVARILARHFKVRRRDVGTAGRKDKRAITRQVFSVHTPGKTPEDFPEIRVKNIAVLWVDLHTNKLRTGELAANRFSIRLRDVSPMRVLDANRVLMRLAKEGVPNFFGEQRFGSRLNNHTVARHLVREEFGDAARAMIRPSEDAPDDDPFRRAFDRATDGDYAIAADILPPSLTAEVRLLRALAEGKTPEEAFDDVPRKHIDFLLCALQSAVFNRVIAERLRDGALAKTVEGDSLIDHETGETVAVEDPTDPTIAERVVNRELSPTGPLIGPQSPATNGCERRALDAAGFTIDDFTRACERFGITLPGARRPLRVFPGDPEIEGGADEHGGFIRAAFDLPPGAFATAVIREISKDSDPITV